MPSSNALQLGGMLSSDESRHAFASATVGFSPGKILKLTAPEGAAATSSLLALMTLVDLSDIYRL
jgi:hypothetical protein